MKLNNHCLIILILFTSCQKEVSIKIPENQNKLLFIEGTLFAGLRPQIYVNNSQSFFSTDVTPQQVFARGALVTLSDGLVSDTLVTDSAYNKFRCRWEPFYRGNNVAVYGKTYHLRVAFNNKSYTAYTTLNQKKATVNSVQYTAEFIDLYGGHDGVIINLSDAVGKGDYYRFQMNRYIDATVHHAHVLDEFVNTCALPNELFFVKDIGRIVFSDENADGQNLVLPIEVSYEYSAGDTGWIFIQTLDKNSASFYKDLDDQLQAIQNPFVEPVFIHSQINGAMGVFGSATLSDSVLFIFPQDNP